VIQLRRKKEGKEIACKKNAHDIIGNALKIQMVLWKVYSNDDDFDQCGCIKWNEWVNELMIATGFLRKLSN